MRRLIVLGCLMVSLAGAGYAQGDMPEEVRRFLDNYTKDSTARFGPLYVRESGFFADSIQIKDLRWRALRVYMPRHNISLDAYPDTVPFSEIIAPTESWRVLIMAHGRPLYELLLRNRAEGQEFVGAAYPHPRGSNFNGPIWGPLLKAYPESTGINPVFVTTPMSGSFFNRGNNFLYFPQKGPRKIYYIRRRLNNARLLELLPDSMEILNDSRKLIEYWKVHGIYRQTGGVIMDEVIPQKDVRGLGVSEDVEKQEVIPSSGIFLRSDLGNNIDEILKSLELPSPTGGDQ